MRDVRLSPQQARRLVGHHGCERRSSTSGLPLLPTDAPLTAAEREALRQYARALRLAADHLDEAVVRGQVAHGLEACRRADDATDTGRRVAAFLGGQR